MATERLLCGLEEQLRNKGPCYVLHYSGCIDIGALNTAFELLCIQYPVLRARTRATPGRGALYVTDDHRPSIVVRQGGLDALRRAAFDSWSSERSMVRLVVSLDRNGGYVAWRPDHAIADARCGLAMFEELWRIYVAGPRNTGTGRQGSQQLPTAPDELLRSRWRTKRQPVPSQVARLNSGSRDSSDIVRRIRLSKGSTRQILTRAKRHHLSVHALICGAVVEAHQIESSVPQKKIACISNVDLRNWMMPRVQPTETTNLLGFHRAIIGRNADTDYIAIGREVGAHLRQSLAERTIYVPTPRLAIPFSETGHSEDWHKANIGINNWGVISTFARPQGVKWIDFLAVWPSKRSAAFPVYLLYTFQGRLSIECHFPSDYFDSSEARRISARVHRNLVGRSDRRRVAPSLRGPRPALSD